MSARTAMERLSDVARRLGATLAGADAQFSRVVTDTRQLQRGDLFVALKGDKFDGHDFVLRAASLGAAGVLVSRAIPSGPSQIVVPDTLNALQRYATSWRGDFSIPVVAVTGSNGKTTTKQLLAAIFAARGPVLATEGNLNNHIGVPLTLLRLRAAHRTAVIEMGANHLGEIARLAAIAKPDIGIVTMAGDSHLEGFGSREGVARGKGELFAALGAGATPAVAVINADDAYAPLWQTLAGRASVLNFGFTLDADVRAEKIQLGADASHFLLVTPNGKADATLPLPGRHNVANALAASAAGVALGLSADEIVAGLATIKPVAGRLNWKTSREGARVLDDTYNANPTSLRAALDLLVTTPGQHWLVLGDMKELGANAPELHAEAGRVARQLGIDRVYTVGPLAQHAADGFGKGHHFDTMESLIDALHADLRPDVAVLVKGSRSSRMERVVAALTNGQIEEAH
jgi:UDP-N-acetylmuramoyl-tripeptide--D-alanyl-D-alanine ligase